jgi:hypothetical protein
MQSERLARPEFWRRRQSTHFIRRLKLRGLRRPVATGWQNRSGRVPSDENGTRGRICTGAIPRRTRPHANTNTYYQPECNTQSQRDGNAFSDCHRKPDADTKSICDSNPNGNSNRKPNPYTARLAHAYSDRNRDGNTTALPYTAISADAACTPDARAPPVEISPF